MIHSKASDCNWPPESRDCVVLLICRDIKQCKNIEYVMKCLRASLNAPLMVFLKTSLKTYLRASSLKASIRASLVASLMACLKASLLEPS